MDATRLDIWLLVLVGRALGVEKETREGKNCENTQRKHAIFHWPQIQPLFYLAHRVSDNKQEQAEVSLGPAVEYKILQKIWKAYKTSSDFLYLQKSF